MCPLDEFPPGVPAPGTQGKQQAWEAEAVREAVRLVGTGELTTEWFLAEGARHRAEREARAAAGPPSPPPEWDPIKDPLAPVRAYQEYRVNEASIMRETVADPDGSGLVREYRAMMASVDASMRDFAACARQRDAARADLLVLAAAVEQQSGEKAQVADERAPEPAPVQLPPGSYHDPLVSLMNRILAVRAGEDVSALRREISAAFYAHGDVTGGNQVNMYLSELVEGGVTEAQRREIATALARYAKADPEEMGRLRGTLMLGAAGSRRPPRTPGAGDPAPNPNAPRVLTREDKRAIRQHEKNIREHEEKLEQYKRDPYSQDNEGRLRNAPNEVPFWKSWGGQSLAVRMREAVQHEADHGQGDHGLGHLGQALVVLGQPPPPAEPAQCPLDHPPARDHDEACRARDAGDNDERQPEQEAGEQGGDAVVRVMSPGVV